jgi:hypothetical protein
VPGPANRPYDWPVLPHARSDRPYHLPARPKPARTLVPTGAMYCMSRTSARSPVKPAARPDHPALGPVQPAARPDRPVPGLGPAQPAPWPDHPVPRPAQPFSNPFFLISSLALPQSAAVHRLKVIIMGRGMFQEKGLEMSLMISLIY